MSDDNPYGFDWGPMSVERVCHIEGRAYVLQIRTDYGSVEVQVTEKGRKITTYDRPSYKRGEMAA